MALEQPCLSMGMMMVLGSTKLKLHVYDDGHTFSLPNGQVWSYAFDLEMRMKRHFDFYSSFS